MKLTLYYALLTTQYGTDLLCGLSWDSYRAQLCAFVLSWAHEVDEPVDYVPDPDHADATYLHALVRQGRAADAIKWYFDNHAEDHVYTSTFDLHMEPPPAESTALLGEALETARDYAFAAFECVADRPDVPSAVVAELAACYKGLRTLEERAQRTALSCPKDPTHDRFRATALVQEHWLLNSGGHFIETPDPKDVQVMREPCLREDVITCAACGAEAIYSPTR